MEGKVRYHLLTLFVLCCVVAFFVQHSFISELLLLSLILLMYIS